MSTENWRIVWYVKLTSQMHFEKVFCSRVKENKVKKKEGAFGVIIETLVFTQINMGIH